MDTALDSIRLGDNVVWRVSDLSEFRLFMEPYVRQAVEDHRNIGVSKECVDLHELVVVRRALAGYVVVGI